MLDYTEQSHKCQEQYLQNLEIITVSLLLTGVITGQIIQTSAKRPMASTFGYTAKTPNAVAALTHHLRELRSPTATCFSSVCSDSLYCEKDGQNLIDKWKNEINQVIDQNSKEIDELLKKVESQNKEMALLQVQANEQDENLEKMQRKASPFLDEFSRINFQKSGEFYLQLFHVLPYGLPLIKCGQK
ncbi:hypothetical protein AVEN_222068-1 [Araneus ventricosus]|uniref:Uncharacterized protein n=1 Tax=Araneus ventricosus TaxID=182803 RepID=A0A4Y2V2Q7_ARAVE|nr:hypothetical protein AVEN_222068-1 [Araneus ventricosus]